MSSATGSELEVVDVDAPAPEPRSVVVQVPAIDEDPDRFRAVLDGIAGQEIVGHDVGLEAWVTPAERGDPMTDPTFQVAAEHDRADVVAAPPGKLSTRNEAHTKAFGAGADLVVSWDADAAPAHRRVLAMLLDPFEAPSTVAAYGAPRAPWNNPVNVAINAVAYVEDRVHPHVNSQLSALSHYAWDEAGPFDEDLDQRDVHAVRQHEEFAFYAALQELGDVVRVPQATVLEEPRRPMHHINRAMHQVSLGRYPMGEWGDGRGELSFQEEEGE